MRKEKQKTTLKVFRIMLFSFMIIGLLVACGESPQVTQNPSTDNVLSELIEDAVNGEVDAEVSITVNRGLEAQTLTTLVVPNADTPLIIEATGTSKSGKDFKVIFYGPSADLDLLDFSGQMRIKAQPSQIQGEQVLRGTAVVAQDASTTQATTLNAYPFIATNPETQFQGPKAGSVFELRGNSSLRAVCGTEDLAGMSNFTGNADAKGIMVGLFEQTPCQQGSILNPTLQSHLHLTAIDTSMGSLLSGPGNMGGTADGKEIVFPVFSLMVKEELPERIGFVNVEVADGVRVLNAEAAKELSGFDLKTGTLVFNELKGSLTGLQKGDVIVSTPRPASPNGFLRRVESIEGKSGQVTIVTSRATLKDAVKSVDVDLQRSFTAADSQQAAAWEEGRLIYPQVDPSLITQVLSTQVAVSEEIVIPVSQIIYEEQGLDSVDAEVKVEGEIRITPTVELELDCSGLLCTKPDFLAKFDLDQSSELTLSAFVNWEDDTSIQLIRIPLPPIVAVFLVFTPEIVVSINASGEINVSVEYTVGQSIDLEVGIEYESGSGWKEIASFKEQFNHQEPEFAASIEARAGLELESRLMLFGMVGVSAGVEIFAEFLAGIPRDPAWELNLGLTGDVAAELDIIVSQEEASLPLFTKTWPIAEALNTAPTITRLAPTSTCAEGTVPRSVAAGGLVRLDANTDDAEDGKGKGRVEWYKANGTPLGATLDQSTTFEGSKHTFDVDLADGEHSIKIKAFDEEGAYSEESLTINVANGCLASFPPFVEITSILGSTLITEGQPVVLEAYTAGGLAGTCCTITWLSDLEGKLGDSTGIAAITGSNPEHRFEHNFDQIASQTITATVEAGGNTATDSIQLRALVQERRPVTDMSPIVMQTADPSLTVYEDDSVSFTVSSSADLVWQSSNPNDNLAMSGNSVLGQFYSSGPRTITVTARDGDGGFSSQTLKLRVQSALARP